MTGTVSYLMDLCDILKCDVILYYVVVVKNSVSPPVSVCVCVCVCVCVWELDTTMRIALAGGIKHAKKLGSHKIPRTCRFLGLDLTVTTIRVILQVCCQTERLGIHTNNRPLCYAACNLQSKVFIYHCTSMLSPSSFVHTAPFFWTSISIESEAVWLV